MPTLTRTRWAAAAALAAFALVLTGCSGDPAATASPPAPAPSTPAAPAPTATPSATPKIPPSKNLDAIQVTDSAFGKQPKVTVKAPFAIDETRSKVLKKGSGPKVGADATVEVHYIGVNGRDNKEFDNSFKQGKSIPFPLSQVIVGFRKGLEGKNAGDRVLIAMPGPDAYDQAVAAGYGPQGMQVGDTLVFVVDIVSASTNAPYGKAVTPPADLPPITDDKGKPVVTIDTAKPAPGKDVVQPLVTGTGPKVGAKDSIMAHYRTWSWKSGKMIEDKYAAADIGPIDTTIECWKKGVVGQPAGSRLMLICTPATSYPNGANNPPIEKGDTVVYVVDILFTTPAALS